jgi:spore coat protein SA
MVATVHTIYYLGSKPTLGKILAWILKPFDKVLFVSERIQKEFVDTGLDVKKTAVFTYWADQSRFKPIDKQSARKVLHWNEEFTVLFVGRLIKEKGVSILVDAARRVGPGVRFVIVSSGTYQEFENMAGKDVPPSIEYVGPVQYDKLHYYYSAADLFVLPSQQREGFSRAVLEAALCGTPTLASNIGCLPDIVDPMIGELVDPPTAESFAKAIRHYVDHDQKLEQLNKRCAEYARVRFSANNAAVIEESFDTRRMN